MLSVALLSIGLNVASQTRRSFVCDAGAAAAASAFVLPCTAATLENDYASVDPSKFQKTPSGARIADTRVGSGAEVGASSRVSLQWVLRRSNGYFVDSSLGAMSSAPGGGTLSLGGDASTQFDPFIFTVGDGKAMKGIEEGVIGMRQGGVRRIVLPVKKKSKDSGEIVDSLLGYTMPVDKSAGPLPEGFGPRRQIERELTKQDPYNYFFFEVEAVKVK